MTVRSYVPATLDRLRRLVDEGRLASDVERFEPEGEDEESEYAALMAAADAAAALLGGPGRRVVVVAEVDAAEAPVTLRDVVAVHCDVADRPADADPDEDLAWFATQEIEQLLAD
ncbi:DUF6912 family protein [Nocardioides sp.]|uniref:DUF6912 family protein n=1 Tax=Nocardioides sp. TaxID=35761 RepID=UPI002ED44180